MKKDYLVLREQGSLEGKEKQLCGDDGEKDPPVPMPNTDVKLLSAEDSEGFPFVKAGRGRAAFLFEKDEKNRLITEVITYKRGLLFNSKLHTTRRFSSVGRAPALQAGGHWFEPSNLHFFEPLAQSVEHLTFNQRVEGSNPSWLIFSILW